MQIIVIANCFPALPDVGGAGFFCHILPKLLLRGMVFHPVFLYNGSIKDLQIQKKQRENTDKKQRN